VVTSRHKGRLLCIFHLIIDVGHFAFFFLNCCCYRTSSSFYCDFPPVLMFHWLLKAMVLRSAVASYKCICNLIDFLSTLLGIVARNLSISAFKEQH
jgi:hypothetical protein